MAKGTGTLLTNPLYIEGIEWPTSWKMGEWKPVFKKGDRRDTKNYRPITSLAAVAVWLGRRTCVPEVSSSSPAGYLDLFHGSPEFKSSATLANSQLVWLRLVGILNNVIFNLNYMFHLFALAHWPLGYKHCRG